MQRDLTFGSRTRTPYHAFSRTRHYFGIDNIGVLRLDFNSLLGLVLNCDDGLLHIEFAKAIFGADDLLRRCDDE